MPEEFDLDPFLDWTKVNAEMARDLTRAVKRQQRIRDGIVIGPEVATQDEVKELIESWDEVGEIAQAIKHTIFTVPALIHTTGEIVVDHPPGHPTLDVKVQKCARCSTILGYWHQGMVMIGEHGPQEMSEEDAGLWKPGERVGKYTAALPGFAIYTLEDDRDLEEHERECFDLEGLDLNIEGLGDLGDFDVS